MLILFILRMKKGPLTVINFPYLAGRSLPFHGTLSLETMQLSKWTIVILFLVLCDGCIEPFEPEIEEENEVLVIDGKITDSEGIQTIVVSRSSPYNSPRFHPVSGCVVRVEDDSGEGITFTENEDGVYQTYLEPDFMITMATGFGKAKA